MVQLRDINGQSEYISVELTEEQLYYPDEVKVDTELRGTARVCLPTQDVSLLDVSNIGFNSDMLRYDGQEFIIGYHSDLMGVYRQYNRYGDREYIWMKEWLTDITLPDLCPIPERPYMNTLVAPVDDEEF